MSRKTFAARLGFCTVFIVAADLVGNCAVNAYGGSETPSEPVVPDTAAEAVEKEDRLSRILFPRSEQNRDRSDSDDDSAPVIPQPTSRDNTACHRRQGATGGLVAKCTFTTPRTSPVRGTLTLTQLDVDAPTTITGRITGFNPQANGEHGFHVHELGDFSRDCASTLAHYNPFNRTHAGPNAAATQRHVGDLGNILVDANGVANVDIDDKVVSLFGRYSVIGRAIVIHKDRDDLGESDYMDSLSSGHSGARIGCCAIVYAHGDEIPTS